MPESYINLLHHLVFIGRQKQHQRKISFREGFLNVNAIKYNMTSDLSDYSAVGHFVD